jgi:CspA family cold shock protein
MMATNFRDTLVTCQECGKKFIFPVEKQREMAGQGGSVDIPSLCEACTVRIQYGGQPHGKGYGFVVEDGGREIFFHKDGVVPAEDGGMPPLEDGQEVLFEVMDTGKGPQAVKVVAYQR